MATLSPAPTTVHTNGQVVVTGLGPQRTGVQQNLPGGLLNGAAAKTAATIQQQASHAQKAGATMRGSGRRRKYRGGAEVHVPEVPEGGTIPGVSFKANHAALLGGLNQLKASASYDGLTNAQPYKVTGGKRRRKTKRHGRNKHRNIRRKHLKRSRHTRRSHHPSRR